MKKSIKIAAIAMILCIAGICNNANAQVRVGISFGVPGVYVQPVPVAPAPVPYYNYDMADPYYYNYNLVQPYYGYRYNDHDWRTHEWREHHGDWGYDRRPEGRMYNDHADHGFHRGRDRH